jgi:glycosyltransferase involved in cell wall biosynthesis
LAKRHEVRVVNFSTILDAYPIWKGACWCDLAFSWFGSVHSFFAVLCSKLLGKRSVVVAGGYDVARLPEIRYGLFSFWWKKWLPRFIFRFADRILAVSKSSFLDTLRNAKADPAKVSLVYLGFDPNVCGNHLRRAKEKKVLCVGTVSKTTLLVKDLGLFAQTSRLLPEVEFILVGKWINGSIRYLKNIASSNMRFVDGVKQERLFDIMSESKVYVQVSRQESFGCALAEAMLCECIPVVTKVAALPEVVGECGFFLSGRSPEKLAVLIKRGMESEPELGRRARQRIASRFPLKRRETNLLQAVEGLMKSRRVKGQPR